MSSDLHQKLGDAKFASEKSKANNLSKELDQQKALLVQMEQKNREDL